MLFIVKISLMNILNIICNYTFSAPCVDRDLVGYQEVALTILGLSCVMSLVYSGKNPKRAMLQSEMRDRDVIVSEENQERKALFLTYQQEIAIPLRENRDRESISFQEEVDRRRSMRNLYLKTGREAAKRLSQENETSPSPVVQKQKSPKMVDAQKKLASVSYAPYLKKVENRPK